MRQRAEEIGASLTLANLPTGGTRLELVFDVQGRRPRYRRIALTRSGDGRRGGP